MANIDDDGCIEEMRKFIKLNNIDITVPSRIVLGRDTRSSSPVRLPLAIPFPRDWLVVSSMSARPWTLRSTTWAKWLLLFFTTLFACTISASRNGKVARDTSRCSVTLSEPFALVMKRSADREYVMSLGYELYRLLSTLIAPMVLVLWSLMKSRLLWVTCFISLYISSDRFDSLAHQQSSWEPQLLVWCQSLGDQDLLAHWNHHGGGRSTTLLRFWWWCWSFGLFHFQRQQVCLVGWW